MRLSPRLRPLVPFAAILIVVPVWAGARSAPRAGEAERPDVVEAQLERDDISFDLDGALAQRALTHRELSAEVVREGTEQPLIVRVTPEEISQLNKSAELPVRVGVVRDVGARISLAPLARRGVSQKTRGLAVGAVRGTPAGGYVYSAAVRSEGATAMRIEFTNFWLPESAELYLLGDHDQVFGPYTGFGPHGDGEFWSHTVMGDEVTLHLRQTARADRDELESTWFDVAAAGHIGPRFVVGNAATIDKSFCQYNADCVENAACGSDPAVNDAENAVAHMQWISGAFIYMCSGGLIADTDGSSTIPYFLSANHCISRNKDARNLENFFQLTAPCGTDTCGDIFDTMNNHPQNLRTMGASVQATNRTGDYTLMVLDEPAPGGSAFLGWTTAPVAFSNGDDLHRISHPQGAPQAYSEHVVDTAAGTCTSWPRGSWIYSHDVYGATEGGSSGSPVVNGAGQVVGQLSGACGFNPSDACDSASNSTVDGAFASYFGEVEQFLDPGTGCTPSPESCTNGTDDDCDGDVDCADSDCSGDPACGSGGCGVNKDPCSDNTDCCSNNCKRGQCKGN